MCNFTTLIFGSLILLINVSRGFGLVCWTCNTELGGPSDCTHPRESKELKLDDRFGSPACITVEYHNRNDIANTGLIMRNILAIVGTKNVAEDCADPNSLFIKQVVPANVKVDKCRICYENLCNLTIRVQANTCLVILGISLSFLKIFHIGIGI